MRRTVYTLAFLLGILARPLFGQSASQAQEDNLVAAAATYDNSRAPMGALLLDRGKIVVADTMLVEQYWPEKADSLWAEVQRCSGVEAPANALAGITFAAVPNADAFYPHLDKKIGPYIGYTFVEKGNILIVDKYRNRSDLVKHEMLHALLYLTGTVTESPWHREPYFQKDCGLAGQ